MPPAVREATAEYRTEMDEIGDFLESCFDLDSEGQTAAREIYRVYRGWAMENGSRPKSQTVLGLSLRKRGFDKKRHRTGIIWEGLSLNEEGYRLLNEGERIKQRARKY